MRLAKCGCQISDTIFRVFALLLVASPPLRQQASLFQYDYQPTAPSLFLLEHASVVLHAVGVSSGS